MSALSCVEAGDTIVLGATVYTVDAVRRENGCTMASVAAYGWVPVTILERNGWRLRSSVALDAGCVVADAKRRMMPADV